MHACRSSAAAAGAPRRRAPAAARAQLNILGSHLYLSSALQSGFTPEQRRELSPVSQSAYLGFAAFLPAVGVDALAAHAESAAHAVLHKRVPPQRPLRHPTASPSPTPTALAGCR